MNELIVLIAIGTLLATVIGLTITLFKVWLDNRSIKEGLRILSDLLEINRKQSERTSNKTQLEKERLELEKKKHVARQKWKNFEAGLKILDFIAYLDEE